MALNLAFDVSRVTDLENRATADEAAMVNNAATTTDEQEIGQLNLTGEGAALQLTQANANTSFVQLNNDGTTTVFNLGKVTAGSNAVEMQTPLDSLTIRTGANTATADASISIITNDSVTSGIDSDIKLLPTDKIQLCPNNARVNTNGLNVILDTQGFPIFQSINTAIANQSLKFASNGIHCKTADDSAFSPYYASAFNTASHRKFKEKIEDFKEAALEKIKKTPVRKYELKAADQDREQFGLIYDEAPEEIRSQDGETIQLYKMVSLLWKAVQELTEQLEEVRA